MIIQYEVLNLNYDYFSLLPNEILLKIFIFLDIIDLDLYKIICPSYIKFKIYLNNLILNHISLKKCVYTSCETGELLYSMSIQFNNYYSFSTSNISMSKVKKFILEILCNKKYKNILNLWLNDKIK